MKPLLTLTFVALLAGCGADAPPEPPASKSAATGISVSGCAQIGVVYGPPGTAKGRC